jgi:DNA replication regulator SLD3
MGDLIEFLKELVLTTSVIDKKYRDTVPEIVAAAKSHVESSSGEDLKRKKRKPKKIKLGKDGLYPLEDGHIRKWWTLNEPELREDEVAAKPEETKHCISSLRTRETQLQMILILEVLALETMRPAEDTVDNQLPGLPQGTPPKPSSCTSKKRRQNNLPVLVDLHADRLCIWQSTTLDELKAITEARAKDDCNEASVREATDPLREFCVDIIIPL